jgi:outer membrane protein TolC
MDMRTQTAIALTGDAWFEYELAEQQVRACKERVRTLRDQLEIARSLSAALRSEWAATGIGQP